jgi:hypothetical protein
MPVTVKLRKLIERRRQLGLDLFDEVWDGPSFGAG